MIIEILRKMLNFMLFIDVCKISIMNLKNKGYTGMAFAFFYFTAIHRTKEIGAIFVPS